LAEQLTTEHRSSSERQLGKTLLKSLTDRAGVSSTLDTDAPTRQACCLVLPFANHSMDDVPIQRILNNSALKDLIPYGSSLRESLFKIRFKYNKRLSRLACTYNTYNEADNTVDSTSTDICCCKDTKYISSINTDLSHVLTSDIHILDQFPDLQLLLQKGTAFKQSFCTDIRSNLTIFDDLLRFYTESIQ
jgi:hypothetical protein